MQNKTLMKLGLGAILLIAIIAGFAGCFGSSSDDSGSSGPLSGDLDTTFGGDGVITATIGLTSSYDQLKALAQQSDGKILAGGTSDSLITLCRYNANGALDATFSDDGIVTSTLGSAINALDIQTDGKILAAGSYSNGGILLRYTITGTLDTEFGANGVVTATILNSTYGFGVKVQADGKILMAGDGYNGSNYDFWLCRYTSSGVLDTDFSTDGVVTATIGALDERYPVLAIQPDNKILLSGNSDGYFALFRYDTDGAPDTTFSSDGVVTAIIGDGMSMNMRLGMVLQPDGLIVLGGHATNGSKVDFGLCRFTITGTLDAGFGTNGAVTSTIGAGTYDLIYGLALQSDGKIVAAGFAENAASDEDFALARYNTDGTLDTTFGANGKVITSINKDDEAFAILIQPDNKIVVGGYTYNTQYDFCLARYWK